MPANAAASRPGWDGGPYTFMRRVLATEPGGALYAKRQTMVEPVFADTKFNRGIDRFLRRGQSATRPTSRWTRWANDPRVAGRRSGRAITAAWASERERGRRRAACTAASLGETGLAVIQAGPTLCAAVVPRGRTQHASMLRD
jgi:Transposase DDE domain